MRHFLLLLLLLGLAIPSARSAEPAPGTSSAPWFDEVREAAALGDDAALRTLIKGEIPPAPAGRTAYNYYTTLALAAFDAGDTAASLRFMDQAGEPATGKGEADLSWISAMAQLFRGERDHALRMAKGYQRLDEQHPAADFILALDAFMQWRQLGPLHPDAEKMFLTARRRIEAATESKAQTHPGFHRRFLILACSIAEFYDNEYESTKAVTARHAAFPRRRPFLRAYLALVPVPSEMLEPLLKAAALSADESAVWMRAAELPSAGQSLSAENAVERLAVLPDRPEFREARLIILRQVLREPGGRLAAWRKQFAANVGAGSSPEARAALGEIFAGFDGRHPELLQTYTRLAAQLGRVGDAYHALGLIDAVRSLDEGQRVADADLEIALAKLAGDPPRAVGLVLAQAPHHGNDVKWLRQHAALIHLHAELPQAFAYLTQLAQLTPDDLSLQFTLASLADRPVSRKQRLADSVYVAKLARARVEYTPEQRVADPDNVINSDRERLSLYAQLFARVPADHVPEPRHWQGYEALLDRNVFSEAFSEGLTEEEVKGRTFRALVERCRNAAPAHPVIAGQYRRLLVRDATALAQQAQRAPASEAPELWQKADAAVNTAAQAGAGSAELETARNLIDSHARRQRELQAAAESDAKARRLIEERQFARQQREAEYADRARDRIRYLKSLGVARDEILREGSAARRPYYTTRQAANAGNAAALVKVIESLCETCNGLGLNRGGAGMVRACTFCGGSGLQYWAKEKGMISARFEGVGPFPFDLEAALR